MALLAPRFAVSRIGARAWRLNNVFVACYLVLEDDGFTLVDCGLPGGAPGILAVACGLGFPLRRLVLTHAHGDHTGSLDDLARTVEGLEILAGRREAPLLAGDLSLLPDEPQQRPRGGFPRHQAQPSRLLDDGERVGHLRVVFTPGHTPGHLALLDERDGLLLAGDAVATAGGLDVAGLSGSLFPMARLVTWDRPLAVQSARRLAELPVKTLACGHGPILTNARAPLQAAVDRAEAALRRATA